MQLQTCLYTQPPPDSSIAFKANSMGDPMTESYFSSKPFSTTIYRGQKDDASFQKFSGCSTNNCPKSDVTPSSTPVLVTPPSKEAKRKQENENDMTGVVGDLNPVIDTAVTKADGASDTVE